MTALLIGKEPACPLGYTYVRQGEHDAVVIGSLELEELLCFSQGAALSALAEGKPVILYEPGLPEAKHSRGLSAALASRRRELKSWGILFTTGSQKKLITAQQARDMLCAGQTPGMGAVLTPLAKEILEGKP